MDGAAIVCNAMLADIGDAEVAADGAGTCSRVAATVAVVAAGEEAEDVDDEVAAGDDILFSS